MRKKSYAFLCIAAIYFDNYSEKRLKWFHTGRIFGGGNPFKAQKVLGDEDLPIVKVWIEERKGSASDFLKKMEKEEYVSGFLDTGYIGLSEGDNLATIHKDCVPSSLMNMIKKTKPILLYNPLKGNNVFPFYTALKRDEKLEKESPTVATDSLHLHSRAIPSNMTTLLLPLSLRKKCLIQTRVS